MNIGELFLNIGIKGAEKTIGALTSVGKGIGSITSTSLEAKAAILALLYGLERLTANSLQQAAGMTQLRDAYGLNIEMLQRYGYQAEQANVPIDQLQQSFVGLFNTIKSINQGANPLAFAYLSQATGFDINKANDKLHGQEYTFQKIYESNQKASLSREMKSIINEGFGQSMAMQAAMQSPKKFFDLDKIAKAPIIKSSDIENLTRQKAELNNIYLRIERAFSRFASAHGDEIIGDVDKLVKAIVPLAEAIVTLVDAVKLLRGLSVVVDAVTGAVNFVTKTVNTKGENLVGPFGGHDRRPSRTFKDDLNDITGLYTKYLLPPMRHLQEGASRLGNNVYSSVNNANITINAKAGEDPHAIGRHAHRGVKDAQIQNAQRSLPPGRK